MNELESQECERVKRRIIASLCVAVVLIGGTLTSALAQRPRASVSLLGAGSSFDLPLFSKDFEVYSKNHSVTVTYNPIGSGAGITQFIAKTVDFGASDVPMSGPDLDNATKAGGPVVQVPVALGGVSIAYHLSGMKSGIKLTGPVLADIYLGNITSWNDKAIASLNKGVKLPSTRITVVHRADSSGTSYIFTDYLSKVSKAWKDKTGGPNKLPNWPTGVGQPKNSGVAALVKSTDGAIGYVEFAYVKENHMTQARILNRSGKYQYPDLKNVQTDAAQFKNVSPSRFSIVNGKGSNSYPISGFSWALLYKNQSDSTKGKALVHLFQWVVTAGQKYANSVDYPSLPKQVQQLAKKDLGSIKA